MCEAIVYLVNNGEEKEIMGNVLFLQVQGERLLLADLLGNSKELSARIRNIDFDQHKVIVEES
ncbi:hypothetical protein ES703_00415 [subsurface metagenome]